MPGEAPQLNQKWYSRAQWRGDWTPVCSEGLTASQSARMAHMDRMVMIHVWGMREEQNSKRVRKIISNKAREPMDAMEYGVKWV